METVSDFDLTEEQLRGIDAFVKWFQNGSKHGFGRRPKFRIAGPAGSGKSTIAYWALKAVGLDPLSPHVAKVAYTGKASMVMRQKGLVGSQTIHSAIYIPVDDVGEQVKEMRSRLLRLRGSLGSAPPEKRAEVAAEIDHVSANIKLLQDRSGDDMQWVLNPNGAIAGCKLVLCDEASMVGGRIQDDLESYDVPVLYLGDGFQLPPILDGNEESVFFDKNGILQPVDFTLTQIHRQAEGSPIIRYSRALRENRVDELNFFGKQEGDGKLIRVPRSRLSIEHLARAEQIIVGKNDTRHRVNADVREFLGRESPYPMVGDKLILLKNNKEFNVVNGMMGVCTSDYYNYSEKAGSIKVDVQLEDGRELDLSVLVPYFQFPGDQDKLYDVPGWSRKKNLHADYGFSCTAHKAQGSQYNSGIMLEEPIGKTDELRRRWLYTAVTRFANSVIMAG